MKYLICGGPGIGDFIIILPMIRQIRKRDENAYIKLIVKSSIEQVTILQDLNSIVNAIDEIDFYSISNIKSCYHLIANLGIKKYDYGFVIQYSSNKDTSSWPYRFVTYASKKKYGINNRQKRFRYNKGIDLVKGISVYSYPLQLLREAGIIYDIDNVNDTLILKTKIKKNDYNLELNSNKSILVFVLGAANLSMKINGIRMSSGAKKWSYYKWIELAKQCMRTYNVILIGGKNEQYELSKLNIVIPEEVINLVGVCNIKESMGVLSEADLVVGSDTGLMHCAGAMGIPLITLFGCTDSNEYSPYGMNSNVLYVQLACSPCFRTEKLFMCKNNLCMKDISVDMVYKKIEEVINKNIS